MALATTLTALLLALLLMEPATSRVLKGKVSCLDCNSGYHLSGIMVLAKCDKMRKLVIATTARDGSFQTDDELPSAATDCMAKLAGGPNQLYATKTSMASKIVNDGPEGYAISTPLTFSTACHSDAEKCRAAVSKFGSSKTVDLPLPREWGLAPSSYYVPFFPIIGVP